ncbi:PREDICTED: protein CHUP1, chloroplastic-like isoform X1 [Lupinus angustifolius]|uniref:protein CHUP1, chloroplastic-like isoform X1 n=1 Tax=Lupinus angustifolius TaxID=3871 RepID=UPI00092F8C3C|nr:PREDICTED: protein CHUP1, chloroplastic-like isoform X1 [Lupinus angustifolius]
MLVRLGILVAASIAAYKVKQHNLNTSKSEHEKSRFGKQQDECTQDQKLTCFIGGLSEEDREKEEQEEKVKLTNSIVDRANDYEDDILPEFERLLSGEIEFPLHTEKMSDANKDRVYETAMANDASELEYLRNLVKELEERELTLEGELLEYYGWKEQESNILELERQLKIKAAEIDTLNVTMDSLLEERKKLQEELTRGASAKTELEAARSKIKELQRQIQLEANQTKSQLLSLRQQVYGLKAKEEEAAMKDVEIEKKLKAVSELEVAVMELKRENKELQHEKRELTVKLNVAESRVMELSHIAENEMVAKAKVEVSNLRHVNEDLLKQVEGLQMNRFSEVEELVYLRWVNACLRYELGYYQAPRGKLSARDLNDSLSPKSQEKAKQLMLEFAASGHEQDDTDLDSILSHLSSSSTEDFDNTTSDSSTSKYSNQSKKTSLIQKLKKWGKSKDDSSRLSSLVKSLSAGSPSRMGMSNDRLRGTLESLMLKDDGDTIAITTFGQKDQGPTDSPEYPTIIRKVSSSDSLNSVAASFQLMSKSVDGSLDEKYPAYKDRHKLALAREKQIKEKAEKARVQKFGDSSNLNMTKAERERPISLPPKLTQIKEKAYVFGSSNDQSDSGKKRPPRVPRPPPKPSVGSPVSTNLNPSNGGPYAPPLPPHAPPLPLGSLPRGAMDGNKVHRAPELLEFYQTLMKGDIKKDTSSLISSKINASDARSNMIGETENRSSFLLAVKADVETQGDFVISLANEVRAASFSKIEDLVAFVNWLDEELSFLVDEQAVLKHFDWPEGKADALRGAAFEYQDLMKLEKLVSTFTDDPKLPCEVALQKMYSLLEKVEQSIYALLRTRDMAISRYKEFGIPVNWLLDSGDVGKIKLSSVQLAKKYMKRVASELDMLSGSNNEPTQQFLILQGVRFAFRVHQFAGGFDEESMKAFEELRSRINTRAGEDY